MKNLLSFAVLIACAYSKPTIDCSLVRCAKPPCDESLWVTDPGACCPRCDCSRILCFKPDCPNVVLPPGGCCPICDCPRNFVFRTCSSCNATCKNPNPICTRECKPPSCNCNHPNAVDKNGNCIPAEKCPNMQCDDPNAKWFDAGPCVSPCGSDPCVHIIPGPPGCYCKDPQNMRLHNGRCLLVRDCPPCRDPNAEFLDLGLVDRRRCFRPKPSLITDPKLAKPGCYCKPGFVLDDKDVCIPLKQCPKLCPPGCSSFFDGCNKCICDENGAACTEIACLTWKHPTCLECHDPLARYFPKASSAPCISECETDGCETPTQPGCYCSDPSSMHLRHGECILKCDCPDARRCNDFVCPRLDLACPKAEDQVYLRPNDCCKTCRGCRRSPKSIHCDIGAPFISPRSLRRGSCRPRCPRCHRERRYDDCERRCGGECTYKTGSCEGTCCSKPGRDCRALRCASRLCPNSDTSFGCTSKCHLTNDLQCVGFTPFSVCCEDHSSSSSSDSH